MLPKGHPDAPITSASASLAKLLIFETVVEGGFGKTLKLEEGALLDLERFEYNTSGNLAQPHTSATSLASPTPPPAGPPPSTGDLQGSLAVPTDTGNRNSRRRFSHFHFRRRPANRSVSGPALAVVDAEPAPTNDTKTKDDGKEGVRAVIRLAALDEQGTELTSPNEQVTYLHVVRFGEESEAEEEARPWVVKVVKREATVSCQPNNDNRPTINADDRSDLIRSIYMRSMDYHLGQPHNLRLFLPFHLCLSPNRTPTHRPPLLSSHKL
jgi:hypothetical protein